MNCPNCNQPVEAGAAFCGNCGQPLQAAVPQAPAQPQPAAQPNLVGPVPGGAAPAAPAAPSPIAQAFATQPPTVATPATPLPGGMAAPMAGGGMAAVPAYSVPAAHPGETRAIIALIAAVISLPGALFPIAGIILGIVGVVLGSLGLRLRKGLSLAAVIVGSVGILASLAAWVWAVQYLQKHSASVSSTHHSAATAAATAVHTPCYSFNLSSSYTVQNTKGSCTAELSNGTSTETTSDAYDIVGGTIPGINQQNFVQGSRQAIHQSLANMPGATIVAEDANATFAGSPAYAVALSDPAKGASAVLAAVMHQTAHGENYFVVSHAVKGDSVDLKAIESTWSWQ